MFLKSLTLKGFKSFADATTLEFEPGVTVVVGPNGSGKSNVVDAVAWVLGAQGPRALRSAKMEDVIFAGTPKRPPLGRAEVSLTIDNSSGLLPIDFSEVTITRTLFRTGDSEYAINRVPCRLLDVQDLLSDTGVGRQQHVIVSQGNLDAILNARPEERRMVIEEAAGILKYRRRKERSERRLESTESSLLRLQDLLREVRRQLRPLEKQADAARRHGDLVAELTAVRRYLAGQELGALESRLSSVTRTRTELTGVESELQRAMAGLDRDVLSAEADLGAARRRDAETDLADALSRAEGSRARARGLVALLSERRRSIERDITASMDHDVVASLEAASARLAVQLADTETEVEALVPQDRELVEVEQALARETDEFDAAWGSDDRDSPSPAATLRSELQAQRAASERTRAELARLVSRQESVGLRARRLDAETDRLRAMIAETEVSEGRLSLGVERAVAELAATEAQLQASDESRRQADADWHRWSARAEALAQALDEARARAGAERLVAVSGVVGTLLELVEVDEGFEAAFESAAAEFVAAVVVEDPEAARRGLAELQRHDFPGAVVALPPLPLTAWSPPGEAQLPGVEWLRPRVRSRLPAVNALLDRAIGSAVIVPGDWSNALDLALARPELVVLTRRGDRYADGVWKTGAAGSGTTGPAVEEARVQAEAARNRADAGAAALQEATQVVAVKRTTRAEAVRLADANASRRRAAAETLPRSEAEVADARRELESSVGLRAEAEGRLAREESRMTELASALPEHERASAVEAEQALAKRAARSRLGEQLAAVAALRRDLEVRAAALEERRNLVVRRLAEVDGRLRRNLVERRDAAARRERLAVLAVATERLHGVAAARAERLDGLLEALRRTRRGEADRDRAIADRLEQLRRQRGAAERQLGECRERAGRNELEQAEVRVRLEALVDRVRRELDCEPQATRGAPCPPLPAGTSPASRAVELERELRLMGPINPLALEEFAALQERHQFLETQLEDVRAGRRELTKVVRAIDAEIVDVFRAAYSDVAEHFEQLFATLFPGGQGRLRLTDPDHLLETGIEVEARPSGKNVRRLSLLSGGERSLTAMAFLFAVFRSRPSPFYLMDEVEAALDDVNLHRFLHLVHEFRLEAQLVIVSHQKRTMEAADCLYGVTMAPGGTSRVVSEKVTAGAREEA